MTGPLKHQWVALVGLILVLAGVGAKGAASTLQAELIIAGLLVMMITGVHWFANQRHAANSTRELTIDRGGLDIGSVKPSSRVAQVSLVILVAGAIFVQVQLHVAFVLSVALAAAVGLPIGLSAVLFDRGGRGALLQFASSK